MMTQLLNLFPLAYESEPVGSSFLLPAPASTFADSTDFAWGFILYVSLFFFVIVVGAMFTFMWKFRRVPGQKLPGGSTHNTPLEIAWTLIPLVLVIGIFFLGFTGFNNAQTIPSNAMRIDVQAQKWNFAFSYPNGGVSNELWIPVDQDVELVMNSSDVIHGCYIPAFRAHRNIVPGRENYMWFHAIIPGVYDLECTQYCGDGHSQMVTKVHVVTQAAYDDATRGFANPFIDPISKSPIAYDKVGEKLYASMGCIQCHSLDGKAGTGPSWKNVYFYTQEYANHDPLQGVEGKPTVADYMRWDTAIRESILYPNTKVVKNFNAGVMPDFTGQLMGQNRQVVQNFGPGVMPDYNASFVGNDVKEKKLRALVQFIKHQSDRYTAEAEKIDPALKIDAAPTAVPATKP